MLHEHRGLSGVLLPISTLSSSTPLEPSNRPAQARDRDEVSVSVVASGKHTPEIPDPLALTKIYVRLLSLAISVVGRGWRVFLIVFFHYQYLRFCIIDFASCLRRFIGR